LLQRCAGSVRFATLGQPFAGVGTRPATLRDVSTLRRIRPTARAAAARSGRFTLASVSVKTDCSTHVVRWGDYRRTAWTLFPVRRRHH